MAEQGAVHAHPGDDADPPAHLHHHEGAQAVAARRELHGRVPHAARAPPASPRLQVRTAVGLLCLMSHTNHYMFKIQ